MNPIYTNSGYTLRKASSNSSENIYKEKTNLTQLGDKKEQDGQEEFFSKYYEPPKVFLIWIDFIFSNIFNFKIKRLIKLIEK